MYRFLLVFFLTLSFPITVLAVQPLKVDSLEAVLKTIPKNSERIQTYIELSSAWQSDNPEKALEYAKSALTLALQLNNEIGVLNANNQLGVTYNFINTFDLALEHHLNALTISKRLNRKKDIGNTFNFIGGVYYNQEDFDKAFSYFFAALEVRRKLGDKKLLAGSYNNVGEILRLRGNYERALEYYFLSLELNKEMGNKRWMAINCNNMGLVYHKLDWDEQALKYLTKSVDLNREIEAATDLASSLNSLGTFHNAKKQYTEALKVFQEAFDIAVSKRTLIEQKEAVLGLSNAYQGLSQPDKALNYHIRYAALKDSIFNDEKYQQVLKIQSRYEHQKKGEEIETLKYKNELNTVKVEQQETELYFLIAGSSLLAILIIVIYNRYRSRQKSNEILRKTLDEKEVLLKEIHHRVKNNLQMISSLLNLQSSKISDEVVREAIEESKNRVKSMALLHQKLYQTHNLSHINFQEYLEQLVDSISKSIDFEFDHIKCEINAADLDFKIDTAVPLGLMINELLTNAYKHAFKGKDSGKIQIDIKRLDENTFELRIEDNGVGLPKDFNIDNMDSLGLELVQALVEQLNGTLDYSSNETTVFGITFEEAA
jgi:two-component sensor histidine kinase